MVRKNILFRMIGFSLLVVPLLVSCNLAAPTVAPTSIPATLTASPNPVVPSATPAATATAVLTLADTATPAITEIVTATVQATAQVVPAINAFCRKGPGTNYFEITFLQQGSAYNVIGRNSLNTWWLVQAPGNVNCWMGDPNASKLGPVDQAAIVQVSILPQTPTTFVNTSICNSTLKTLGVSFNWSAVQDVTGYRIYRNGIKLIEVGPSVLAYHDDAPAGENLVYELEAFNAYGVAARASTSVPACN